MRVTVGQVFNRLHGNREPTDDADAARRFALHQ
jgi:hypothetical protein